MESLIPILALVFGLLSLASLVWLVSFAVRRRALGVLAALVLFLLALTTHVFFRAGNHLEDYPFVLLFYPGVPLDLFISAISSHLWAVVIVGLVMSGVTALILKRVGAKFRPVVAIVAAVLTFEAQLLAQDPLSAHRMVTKAAELGLEIKSTRSFRDSVKSYGYGGFATEFHGEACKADVAYFWSYRQDNWVAETPSTGRTQIGPNCP